MLNVQKRNLLISNCSPDHSRSRSTPNRTQAEILRQQQEFLNSANFTSAQGPRPSYLSSSSIPSTYQAAAEPGQAPPRPRNIARCSRGKPGAAAGRGGLSARGRSSVSTNHNLPKPRAPRSTARRGNSSRGRGSAMTQGGVVGRPCEVEVDEPPPTYGSWMKDEEGGASDYSDGNTVRYQDSEGVGSENGNDATDFEEHEFYTDPDNALNEEEEEEEDDNDDGEGAYGRYYYGNPFRDQYPDHYSSEVNSDENSDEIGNSDAYAESLQSYHSEREEGEEGEEELQYSDTSGRQYDSESDMWENYAF
ncbi:hypothetical protein BDZ91DRAFT_193039 [Kalaharituber pfeilii]|nr:hypothetical protein BDZ91DRAFT_193039 [Kalaharituber pfeilii]